MTFVFNETSHTYEVDGARLPSVTEICSLLRPPDNISPEVLRQAARRGTAVHEYAQLLDYGIEPDEMDVEPELAGYVTAYIRFLRDYKPEWELIEQPLYSLDLGFAGTLDRFGEIDGQPVILDIKTASSVNRATRISWAVQLAGYLALLNRECDKRLNLLLKKDGTYQLIDAEDTERKYSFTASVLFSVLLDIKHITGGRK